MTCSLQCQNTNHDVSSEADANTEKVLRREKGQCSGIKIHLRDTQEEGTLFGVEHSVFFPPFLDPYPVDFEICLFVQSQPVVVTLSDTIPCTHHKLFLFNLLI